MFPDFKTTPRYQKTRKETCSVCDTEIFSPVKFQLTCVKANFSPATRHTQRKIALSSQTSCRRPCGPTWHPSVNPIAKSRTNMSCTQKALVVLATWHPPSIPLLTFCCTKGPCGPCNLAPSLNPTAKPRTNILPTQKALVVLATWHPPSIPLPSQGQTSYLRKKALVVLATWHPMQ